MENKSHALAAGAFVLVIAVLLVAMAAWLARDTTERRQFEISSPEGVTGLQPQASVRYKGVLVGRVTDVSLDTVKPGNVLLLIAVNERAPVTRSTFATLGFQGVTGLAFVQLDDKGEDPTPLTGTGSALPRIPMRPSLVSRLTDQGGNLLTQLESASVRVNSLIADENQKALMQTIAQLGQTAAHVGTLAQRADQVLASTAEQTRMTLQSMRETSERLGESGTTVRNSAAEFQRMSRRMNEPGGTLDQVAQGTETLAATARQLNSQVLPRLGRATDDTGRAARQVGRVAESVGSSPQTLLWGRAQLPGPGEAGFVAPPQADPARP
ncbi:MAG: MlaD family protein [Rhodoferax sp.]|nr:MlaD family protein [Rhodoferax sp.]